MVTINISSTKAIGNTLSALLAGATVSTFVALLSYFGIRLGESGYLSAPNFNLTGSTITASILATLAFILGITTLLKSKTASSKVLLVAAVCINLLGVALLGSTPTWVVLAVGLATLVYTVATTQVSAVVSMVKENKVYFLTIITFVVATVVMLITPATRSVITNPDYPRELRLPLRESWVVSSSIMRDFPILGTGPSTFNLNYTRYKPLSVNSENFWSVTFSRPGNEVLGIVSSLGIVGFLVFLFLILRVFKVTSSLKAHINNPVLAISLCAVTYAMLSLLLVHSVNVTTGFLLVMFLALGIAKSKLEASREIDTVQLSLSSLSGGGGMSLIGSERSEIFQYIMAIPVVAITLVGGFYIYREYAGEYFMRQAIVAAQKNDGLATYEYQQRAISTNPTKDSYHNTFANTNLALAGNLSARGNELTDDDRATVQTLISQSVGSSRITTETLNPLNAANWEIRASIYRALIGVAEDANTWAVNAYNTAIRLDPVNPRLRLELGGVYYAAEDYLSAANLFSQAVSLKDDYANAHYNFAQALKMLQRYEDARRELVATRRLLEESSADYEAVNAEIKEIEANFPTAAGNQKPTVDEIAGTQPEEVEQEPLTNVGEEVEQEAIEEGTIENVEEIVQEEEEPQE